MSKYWGNYWQRRMSRRGVVSGGAALATGLAGMAIAGCGDDDDDDNGDGGNGDNSQLTPVAPTQDASAKPVKGGTLRVLTTIGSNFDPHRTNTPAESYFIWGAVGNTLIRFSTKDPGATEGDLAASLPEIPADGVTLIFKLRPEAKWQNRAPVNGRAVTAEDVKLSFERIKDPAIQSPRAGNFGNVDSITVIDDKTVQFKLKAPQADLFSIMADQYNFVIPKEIAVRGLDAIQKPEDVIGSGPYELAASRRHRSSP